MINDSENEDKLMKANTIFDNLEEAFIYMERYVNNGSPSGWTQLRTTSTKTNPFMGNDRFPLLEFSDSDIECELLGEPSALFAVNYAHPDSANSQLLRDGKRNVRKSSIIVSPTSGGRTMLIRSGQYSGFIKLTYDSCRLGRVDRQLSYGHCMSSLEVSNTIKNSIDNGDFGNRIAILLEKSAKISKLKVNDWEYEWGTILREIKPYPYIEETRQIIPGFAMFGKDLHSENEISDEYLVNQFITLSGRNPKEYLIDLLKISIDAWFLSLINCSFILETHGQNCYYEIDKNYNITRFVIKDLDSVDKDISFAKIKGLNTKWKSFPYACFYQDTPEDHPWYYKVRPSYMFDFKMGTYLLDPIVKVVCEKFNLIESDIRSIIQKYTTETYMKEMPKGYFPENGTWYYCDNSERKPGERRKYYAKNNPLFRLGKENIKEMKTLTSELFDSVVNDMTTSLDSKGNHLNMVGLIVSQGDTCFTHYFRDREPVDLRSISKPITCLAFGAAIEEGLYLDGQKITLDTKVGPLLSKYVTINNSLNQKAWNILTFRDCFKITLGHDKGIMFSKDVKTQDENKLIDYVVNYPITTVPGKDFVYSNAGTFVLSTLITEYLGISLSDFVDKYIFKPLDITDYSWRSFGKYCAGCTGLKMHCEDLHKIAKLFADKGVYQNKQVVPKAWINNMILPLVYGPTHRYKKGRAFPKFNYGMNMWICGDIDDLGRYSYDGNYYCDGTDGQYIIIIPKNNIVIAATGFQSDTEPVSRILGYFK